MTVDRSIAPAPPRHSMVRSVALHLAPGILATAGYLILAPALMPRGIPALMSLLLATLLVLLPIELGLLLFEGHRRSGALSLKGIVVNREPIRPAAWFGWFFGLVVWGLVSSMLASPLDAALKDHAFGWLPSWFFVSSLAEFAAYSLPVRVATFSLGLVVGGILGPIVEELYFRGYLMPGLSRFGRWAPLLSATLFSLYHFWTPWQNPSRLLLSAALSYVAASRRNLYPGMAAHCALNAVVWSVTFSAILR